MSGVRSLGRRLFKAERGGLKGCELRGCGSRTEREGESLQEMYVEPLFRPPEKQANNRTIPVPGQHLILPQAEKDSKNRRRRKGALRTKS